MWTPLQASVSPAEGQFVVIIYNGRGATGHSRSLISSSIVTKRKSSIQDQRVGDEECAAYVVPDDATDDILSSFQIDLDWFKTLDRAACPIYWC